MKPYKGKLYCVADSPNRGENAKTGLKRHKTRKNLNHQRVIKIKEECIACEMNKKGYLTHPIHHTCFDFSVRYAYKTEKEDCSFEDHNPQWCGDCYACSECGLRFVPIVPLK